MEAEDGTLDEAPNAPSQPAGTEDISDFDLGDGRTVIYDRSGQDAWIEADVVWSLDEMR